MKRVSPKDIIPGAFGGSPNRVRLSTPPIECRRRSGPCACAPCSDGAEHTLGTMDFDMLFDSCASCAAAGMPDANAVPDDAFITTTREEAKREDENPLDPFSVYCRIVRTLSRPRDLLEQNIAKRFAAAVNHVGEGELGDAAYIEALQRAFNSYKMDPVNGADIVAKTAADDASSASTSASDCPAFVATTPGGAGHAALLNLRHSFLWIKPSDSAADAAHVPLLPSDMKASFHQGEPEILVLEPNIKAHFVISRPTEGYQRLLDALPKHFVGTHKRLVELVNFVCEQMLVSFRDKDMSVPPWRKNKSILSKWFLPASKSTSQPTTPAGSPSRSPMEVRVRSHDGVQSARGQCSFGSFLPGQEQQVEPPAGTPMSPIAYAAPVVGELASPNKVAFGFTPNSVIQGVKVMAM